jgi:Uma2 family endonuclease
MPDTDFRHNQVAANVITAFSIATRELSQPYIVLNSNQSIYIESKDVSVYADALIVFENPVFWQEREEVLTNPLVIVEVTSAKTHNLDHIDKFEYYKSLPSFKEYILIDPNKSLVETWSRKDENTWITKTITDMDGSLAIAAIEDITILLSDIYERVKFPIKAVKKKH